MCIYYLRKYLEFGLQPGTVFLKTFLEVEPEHSKAAEATVWQKFLEFTKLVPEGKH